MPGAGRVVAYDARKKTVRIETETGKRASVPASGLSAEDQAYVRAWQTAAGFMDEHKFRIGCRRESINESKEAVREDFVWGGADTEHDRLVSVIMHEEVVYNFEVRNMTTAALSGVRMEYQVYYEPSKMTRNGSKPE